MKIKFNNDGELIWSMDSLSKEGEEEHLKNLKKMREFNSDYFIDRDIPGTWSQTWDKAAAEKIANEEYFASVAYLILNLIASDDGPIFDEWEKLMECPKNQKIYSTIQGIENLRAAVYNPSNLRLNELNTQGECDTLRNELEEVKSFLDEQLEEYVEPKK